MLRRTENPHEANLFFVPMLLYFYSGNLGVASAHVRNVIAYVRSEFPFWNRTRGADHFLIATQVGRGRTVAAAAGPAGSCPGSVADGSRPGPGWS